MKTAITAGEPPIGGESFARDRRSVSREQTLPPAELLQLKTILVPLDFSSASMEALKYTIRLAEEFRAAIHLLHVQPTDELTAISKAGHLMLNCADSIALMQDRLSEIQERHEVQFWPDNCHVLSGRPFVEISRLADEIEADLIVLPTRGYTGLKHVVLGSTAERVVRYAPCPVLVLRGAKYQAALPEETPFELRKILVPVDFSRCSLAGVRYAARLARSTGASLRFLHVVFPYSQLLGIDRVSANSTSLVHTVRETAADEMTRLTRMRFLRGIDCETRLRVGPAVDEICGESASPEVDLVVASTHGRTGFKRALIGSITEHVVRYAECPVLTVPSRNRL